MSVVSVQADVAAICDRITKGLVCLGEHFRTKPQLDLALVALRNALDLLDECNEEEMSKALGLNVVFRQLKAERASLREDIDDLLAMENYSLRTVFKARKVRFRSEKFQRKTLVFSEDIREMVVDDKFQQFILDQTQFHKPGPAVSSEDKNDPLEHVRLTIRGENEKVMEYEKIPKAAHALAAAQLGPLISNNSINQVTINNSIHIFTCQEHIGTMHKQGDWRGTKIRDKRNRL